MQQHLDAWDLKVPVKLILAASDISSTVSVRPVYILASRQCYLTSLALQALPFFRHVLPNLPGSQSDLTPWFEFQRLPLRWHLPLGPLFDLLSPQQDLPWTLTVHYRNMPPALLSWQNDVAPHEHFFHSLKEACYVCKGSDGSNAVMRMAAAAQDELWRCIEAGDGGGYHRSLAAIKVVPSQRHGSGPSLPVRVLLRQLSSDGSPPSSSMWDSTLMTSRPLPAQQPDGSPTTLADLLFAVAPALFPGLRAPPTDSPRRASTTTAAATPATAAPAPTTARPADAAAAAAAGAASAAAGPSPAAPQSTCEGLGEGVGAASPVLSGAADQQQRASDGRAVGAGEDAPAGGAAPRCGSGEGGTAGGSQPRAEPGCSHEGGGGAGDGRAPHAGQQAQPLVLPEGTRAIVAGIEPPLETPVAWLHARLHAADFFLYVVALVAARAS